MDISSVAIPSTAEVSVTPQALANKPQLAYFVAAIIAVWADIEGRLEAIYVQILNTDGREARLATFRQMKGWGRRTAEIVREAETYLSAERVDELKAVLREVALPAGKRHELAHGIWGEIKGRTDAVALFPESIFTDVALRISEAAAAGTPQIDARIEESLSTGCIVSVAELDVVRAELVRARSLVHNFQFRLMPPELDLTGQGFSDAALDVAQDPGVAGRVINAARTRQADER